MDAETRRFVQTRANFRCEYCRMPESAIPPSFHIEHIRAKQHGGEDDPANLALACDRCNLHKGPNLSGIDPTTNQIVHLFHPRFDLWDEHFRLEGAEILGLTEKGRATAKLLQMNAPRRVRVRMRLMEAGSW